jgi:hypothetical protein
MDKLTKFKAVGGFGVNFFIRKNSNNLYNWLKADPRRVFELHDTGTWINSIASRKRNRLAGQTRREIALFLGHKEQSLDSQYIPFGELGEMFRDTHLFLREMQKELPKQVRLSRINKITFLSWSQIEQKAKWGYHDLNFGWNEEEVDLNTTLIMDGLKTGNYPKDDFEKAYEIQEFFQDQMLDEYYEKMGFTSIEQKLPIFCRGGGLGALQVGEEDAKIIFADPIKFTPDDIHNNDRMSVMRKKYLTMPDSEKRWIDPIYPVASLFEQMRLGKNNKLVTNLFEYIEKRYPGFPRELLPRLVVSFNDDGTVELLAVMVRSYGYAKQNALPGLEHPNYRNIQPFGDTTGFKTIAPTNFVGSFAEQVTNGDLFVFERKLFHRTFAEASNTQHFIYLPPVQFQIRQMVKELTPPEKELLQFIDTQEFWTLLDREINTNFRALTRVPTEILDRQMILFEIYKQCTPVAALLKEKPDLEVELKILFMTFVSKFQG